MSSEKEIIKEIVPSEPNNSIVNELVSKVSNLEKAFDIIRQKQEEFEKLIKLNSSNNLCTEQKTSEHDSTANTNQEDNEIKNESGNQAKNEMDIIYYLKNFISEVSSLVENRNTDMNKKFDEFAFKQNTKYTQVTERMNLFYSNLNQEFDMLKSGLEKKLENKERQVDYEKEKGEKLKDKSFLDKPQKEKTRKTTAMREIQEKMNYMESALKESIQENQQANKKLISTIDKSINNMNQIQSYVEEKIDEMSDKISLDSSKFQTLSNRIAEFENNDKEYKKTLSKFEKTIDTKFQEISKGFNSKISDLSKIFLKNSDLDLIFENQSFTSGIGEIVTQLENMNSELNKTFLRMGEFDKIFQNVNQEIMKIKESHNLLVDKYDKRINSVENKFEELGLKTIKSQIKQYEDLIRKKDIYDKQYEEKRDSHKEINFNSKFKEIEDSVRILEKTIKSIQNLIELNQSSFYLKFHEIDVRISNETNRFFKSFKEIQDKLDNEGGEIKKKLEQSMGKINEIDVYLQTFNKNLEENRAFEMTLLDDYKNLYEKHKDKETVNSISEHESPIKNSFKFSSKSSNNLHDKDYNIKNLILIIESHSMQRYNQMKKQISDLSKLVNFNKLISNELKKFTKTEIINFTEKLKTLQTNYDQITNSISDKLKENNCKYDLFHKEFSGINTLKIAHVSSIWDTIALFTNK